MEDNQTPQTPATESVGTPVAVNVVTPSPPAPPSTETPLIEGMTTPEPAPAIVTEAQERKDAVEPPVSPPTAQPAPGTTMPAPSGKKSNMLVIVIAIIVLLGLLGGVAYMYTQQQSTKIKSTGSKPPTTQTATKATTVSTKDVDATTKTIDDSLSNIDATKDFSSSDLSDATLGL